MIRTLADSVTSTLRSRTHSFQRSTTINKNLGYEQFAAFSLTFVFLLPVSDCRAQQLFHSGCSLFRRELQNAERSVHFHPANHVSHETHLTGGSRNILQFRKIHGLKGFFSFFSRYFFSCSHYLLLYYFFRLSCLFFLITCMAAECTCRCKFTQFVSYHVFCNVNRNKFISVMNCNCVPYKIRRDH